MRARTCGLFAILCFSLFAGFGEWEKGFTLADIIQLGLENNPVLKARAREVEARKAAFQASKLIQNPELELHAGKAQSHDAARERSTEGVTLSQHLENPLKRHYRVQTYEKAWQAAEHFFRSARLEIIHDIKRLFFQVFLFENRELLARKSLETLRETHRLIEKRVKLGETRELEAIKLSVETLRAQNELNRVQTELNLARENLNRFLGNVLPADFSVSGRLEYTPLVLDEQTLLNTALLSHPLIKGKEEELGQAESHLSYIKWKRFPDFRLSGFIHDELDGRNKGFGISLDIPLWNFKSREIAEAESLFLKQKEELEVLKMEISIEVKTQLDELRLSEQTLALFHEGLLKQAEESLNISDASYKQGEISLIDYLDSQRTYYSILKDYQDSLYAWNARKAALEKSIGEELK